MASPQTVRVVRDLLDVGGAMQMHTTTYGARKAAYGNTVRLNGEKADLIERKYGWEARQAFSAQVARNFKVHVERYYCGDNEHLKETAASLHSFAQDYWYLPVAPTLADWCGYVAEGDVRNTVLYGIYSLLEVVPGGSSVFRIGENFTVKAGSKLSVGSGFAEAAASITSTAKSPASTTTKAVTILNRGSTGRTKAAGLLEELAMEATKADPLATAKELKKGFSMFDPRWPKESGWVKMQNLVPTSQGNINIHFLYNKNTNEFDDFKFISNEIKGCYNPYRGGIDN